MQTQIFLSGAWGRPLLSRSQLAGGEENQKEAGILKAGGVCVRTRACVCMHVCGGCSVSQLNGYGERAAGQDGNHGVHVGKSSWSGSVGPVGVFRIRD